jgi:hypothetical protein
MVCGGLLGFDDGVGAGAVAQRRQTFGTTRCRSKNLEPRLHTALCVLRRPSDVPPACAGTGPPRCPPGAAVLPVGAVGA